MLMEDQVEPSVLRQKRDPFRHLLLHLKALILLNLLAVLIALVRILN